MATNLYVGNLPFHISESQVYDLFAQHGHVEEVKIVSDRQTGQPRGFAFIEMGSNEEARKAISAVNGLNWEGRDLKVNEARPKTPRGGGGGRRNF